MASGDLAVIKYVPEVTLGTTPASALTKVNALNFGVNGQISSTVSGMINPARADLDVVLTSAKTAGDMGIEWSYGAYNKFIESALGGTFSTAVAMSAATISSTSTDNSINDSGAGFSTVNILPGHWIVVKGFTGANAVNNGKPAKVVSVTTAKIVLTGITLVTNLAGDTVTVKGSSVRNGITLKSFSLEVEHTDMTTTFEAYKGMIVNTMSLSAASGAIVTGAFGFTGMTTAYGSATIGTGAEVAATTNDSFNPTNSMGTIYEAGVAMTGIAIKSLNLTTTNNVRDNMAIGSLYPTSVKLGTLGVTGTMSMYFASQALLTKFINSTATSLSFNFKDSVGNVIVFDMPKVKFSTATLSGFSKNSDVMLDMGFTALYSSAADALCSIQISSCPL